MTAHWFVPAGLHTASARLPVEGELPSFGGATGWLNSPPLTPAALHGKVVLAGFWTCTCINWLRQLPYIRAWAATTLNTASGQIAYRFHARDLHLVMGPAASGTTAGFRVLRDAGPDPAPLHRGGVHAP